jgi:hypothetical protein
VCLNAIQHAQKSLFIHEASDATILSHAFSHDDELPSQSVEFVPAHSTLTSTGRLEQGTA